MSLIEKAAKRLEELKRVGAVPSGAIARPRGTAVPPRARRDAADRPPSITAVPGTLATGTSLFIEKGEEVRRSKSVNIDIGKLAMNGYLSPDAPNSPIADDFRVIKRPLLANARGKSAAPIRRGNLVMVTSSLPGEGKTYTAVNLALSIAMEVDNRVLLVDADVARPAVLERLGLSPAPGLLDLLTKPELDMANVLLRCNIERLSILPAGTQHARAAELLASEAMNALLDELAARYSDRIVIFDAPPLLVSTESRALASQVGQVLMVVEADRTSQGAVRQSLAMLEGCPIVMSVLNKCERAGDGNYYGQYSRYGE